MIKEIIIAPATISERMDLNLLEKYGFCFEKNIKIYLHEIAEELRKSFKEQEEKSDA